MPYLKITLFLTMIGVYVGCSSLKQSAYNSKYFEETVATIPAQYEQKFENIPVFTGQTTHSNYLDNVSYMTKQPSNGWEYRVLPDCDEALIKNCEVLCLVKKPAEFNTFQVVNDTNYITDFKWVTVDYFGEIIEDEHKVKVKKLKREYIDNEIIAALENILQLPQTNENYEYKSLMRAITIYKKENNLKDFESFYLDAELLSHMGIDMNEVLK